MNLTHGNTVSAVIERINARALAIVQNGATDAELHDETDVNANEPREIELSRELAALWINGQRTDACDLPGVKALFVA